MKRIICLITALCLILGSFSFAFATDISWNTTDSGHLTEIRNSLMSGGTIYNLINSCITQLNNINYNLVTLMGWLDPSNGGGTTALLNQILNMLSYTDAAGALKSFISDIYFEEYGQTQYLLDLRNALSNIGLTSSNVSKNSHTQLNMDGNYYFPISIPLVNGDGQNYTQYIGWNLGSPLGNIAVLLKYMLEGNTTAYMETYHDAYYGNSSIQTYYDPLSLNTSTFTPTSMTNGLYTWLSKIQQPTARLAYVLASPERIAAQEAAADNEEAVVDNFIDSSGAGSASTSDIGSISDLSSGYKSNFGSDASVTGIFNIFNSNNMGWFSQETANQLDTTAPTRRGSSFDTPLLDQQIEDIYDQIGVKHD